jgi:hypothetical protein
VLEWGAVGNGVTNDTTALRTALSAAIRKGVGLYFPTGTYLTGTLTVPSSLAIRLNSGATVRGNAGTIISCTGGTMTITGGTFNGGAVASGNAVIEVTDATATINTTVTNTGLDGIRYLRSSGTITTTATSIGRHAVALVDSSNVTIVANVNTAARAGVHVTTPNVDSTNIDISGTFASCGQDGTKSAAVNLNSSPTAYAAAVKNSTVHDVTVTNAGWVGILITGDDNTAEDCSVSGSGVVQPDTGHGIWNHDAARSIITRCTSTGSQRSGFLDGKSFGGIYTDCVAYANQHAGFWFTVDPSATIRYQGAATNKDAQLLNWTAYGNDLDNTGWREVDVQAAYTTLTASPAI